MRWLVYGGLAWLAYAWWKSRGEPTPTQAVTAATNKSTASLQQVVARARPLETSRAVAKALSSAVK